jgi:putative FmdB family regulatory protein
MPLYEYQCQECDGRFERIERASTPTDGVCPDCGGTTRRLLGAPALKFKGTGWYVNDYGKGNGGRSSSTDASTPTTTDAPANPTTTSSSDSNSPAGSSKVA